MMVLVSITACGSESDSPQKLVSAADGGSITIEVPAGALSEDTEITISRVNNEVLESGDLLELAAYVFEPDGTMFSKPVQISLELPSSLLGDGFRLVHAENSGSDDQEAPPTTPLTIDSVAVSSDGKTTTVTTTISSFSSMKVYRSTFFGMSMTAPKRAVEGVPFNVQAVPRQTSTEPVIVRRQVIGSEDDAVVEIVTIQPGEKWSIYGRFNGRANVSPELIQSSPPETGMTTPAFTTQESFTCSKAGTKFQIEYHSFITIEELWKFSYSPDTWEKPNLRGSWGEYVSKTVTGECLAPEGGISPSPAGALPTSTVDPVGQVAETLLSTPSSSNSEPPSSEGSSGTAQLSNGMTVEVSVDQWGNTRSSTMKRIWAGSIEILKYSLNLTVSGQTPDGKRLPVEYQVFSVESGDLEDVSDPDQDPVGADAGDLEKTFVLGWAGDYVVKGKVGDEPFEIAVEAVEPPIRYGILAESGTWSGQTELSDEDARDLAHFSGEWSGWTFDEWEQQIADGGPVDVLKNQTKISLERTDLFIHPIDAGVPQPGPDGSLLPHEMIVPKAYYEGTLTYNLPALSYEDGNCANEPVTYSLLGAVEYAPHEGPWSAPLILDGTLFGTLPELTSKLPTTVKISVVPADSIDHERMMVDGSGRRVVGPLPDGSELGFEIVFADIEPNPSSTLTDESTCTSSVSNIALRTMK